MIRVLFVCSGNICRSPMAEAVFQDRVNRAGLGDKIQADSAGTGRWHLGETAHPGTLAVLRRHNIAYHGRARQVSFADFENFDYILAMDRDNLHALRRLGRLQGARPELFLRWAVEAGTVDEDEVPDPYYDGRFDQVYDLVVKGAEALLAQIRAEHNL